MNTMTVKEVVETFKKCASTHWKQIIIKTDNKLIVNPGSEWDQFECKEAETCAGILIITI